MNSHYNKNLKSLAKELRNNSTFGEVILLPEQLKIGFTSWSNQSPQPPLKRGNKHISSAVKTSETLLMLWLLKLIMKHPCKVACTTEFTSLP